MSDYHRFLKAARGELAHVRRIAARLLAEGNVGQGVHDALATAAMHILHDAYQAGRCEPAGVTDLVAELAKVGSDA
jgi:hypothetical protein